MHEFSSPRTVPSDLDLSSPRSIPLEFDAASRGSRTSSGLTNLTRQLGALQEEIRYRPSLSSTASGGSGAGEDEENGQGQGQRWGSRVAGVVGDEASPTAPLRMHAFAPPRISALIV